MACEICTTGIPKAGEDICEECYDRWAEEECQAQEAERNAELAYLQHLELPSMNEPIDEYEAAMKGMF